MLTNVQRIAKYIGDAGCYFLSLCKIAEDDMNKRQPFGRGFVIDPLAEAANCINAGCLGTDGYVRDPERCLYLITGVQYSVRKAGEGHDLPLGYALQEGELEVLRFERPNPEDPANPYPHFVTGKGSGPMTAARVDYDPWVNSLTVATGSLVSRRIIRRK